MTDRAPPLDPPQALADSLRDLHAGLDRALQAASTTSEERRDQLALILHAFFKFVSLHRSVADPIRDRLFDLQAALANLNEGVVVDLLRAKNRPGKKVDSISVWQNRVAVCLAFTLLCRVFPTQDDAAAHILKMHPWTKGLAGGRAGKIAHVPAIKGWEWKLRKNLAPKWASELYAQGMALIEGDISQDRLKDRGLIAYADSLLVIRRQRR